MLPSYKKKTECEGIHPYHLQNVVLPGHHYQQQGVPALLDQLHHLGVAPAGDVLPVDGDDPVADAEAGRHGRAVLFDRLDKYRVHWLRDGRPCVAASLIEINGRLETIGYRNGRLETIGYRNGRLETIDYRNGRFETIGYRKSKLEVK